MRQKERNGVIDEFDYNQLDDWQKNDNGREKVRDNLELNDDSEEEEHGGRHFVIFNEHDQEEEFTQPNAFFVSFREEELRL